MTNMIDVERLFRTSSIERDKFLSRLFGIFNEEVARIWSRDARAPYSDIGRPTIYDRSSSKRGSTLDFCLEHRETKRRYVTEMKCEMQYQNYKYLTLINPSQLNHHKKKEAFERFLGASKSPKNVIVKVGGKVISIHGGILIWGKVTDEGRSRTMNDCGFADILSLELILRDLIRWNNQVYSNFITEKQGWCDHLFNGLTAADIKK